MSLDDEEENQNVKAYFPAIATLSGFFNVKNIKNRYCVKMVRIMNSLLVNT